MTKLYPVMMLVVMSIIFSAATLTFAQETKEIDLMEMSLDELLHIKVQAATKTEVTQLEVPQAVTVLHRADIEKRSANNLPELLRSVVGANVVRVQTSQNVLGTRGGNAFSPSKVLILIDGQPIDPTLFSTTWWELVPVSIDDIERIEFIRSPGTIYGANAQNGVVNIITQKIGLGEADDHKVKLVAKSGQQNVRAGYLGYIGKVGNLSYRLSTDLNQVNAYENATRLEIIPGKMSAPGEQTFSDNKNHLNLQNFSGAVQIKIRNNVLNANAGFKNIKNAQGRVPDRLCFVGIEGLVGYFNANYLFESPGAKHRVHFGSDLVNYEFLRNADPGLGTLLPAEMRLNKLNAGYELQASIGRQHNFLVGANYGVETANNASGEKFLINETVDQQPLVSLYGQDEWRITENDRLYFGGLYSHHYVSGANFSPMIAYVHKLDDKNVLRVATFTSYRNPNVFEHSMDYDQSTGSSGKRTRLISNRGLKAERTTSYEIGFRGQPTEHFFFSTDFYYNQLKDGIEWTLVGVDSLPSLRPRYRSENSLEQEIGGMEVVLKYQLNRHWNVENNVAVNIISNRSLRPEYRGASGRGPNNVGEGRYGASYVPPYIYNAILNFRGKRVHANLHYQHSAAHTWQWPSWSATTGKDSFTLKPVPRYDILNAYVGVNFTEHLGAAIEGYNLLDDRHTEWRGDESYFGRIIWAKINARY